MAKLKVLAGDFKQISGSYNYINFRKKCFVMEPMPDKSKKGIWGFLTRDLNPKPEEIHFDEIEEMEVATEESVKRIGGTIGWGVAGAALLGPVGLLAGLLLGGKGKDVIFVCKFKDGRKLIAQSPSADYNALMVYRLDNQ